MTCELSPGITFVNDKPEFAAQFGTTLITERGVGLYKKEEHGRGNEEFRAGGGGDRPGMGERGGGARSSEET
jgi:hypothetical protein